MGVNVCESPSTLNLLTKAKQDSIDYVVNAGLLSKIELLEAENRRLKASTCKASQHFRIEQIQNNDRLFRFYTGFISYSVFFAFFKFLGPVVYELEYWSSKRKQRKQRSCKLDPINQLFLTLVKLRLNLKVQDLAYRSILKIPTKVKCPANWTREYYGYLMTEHYSHSGRTMMNNHAM